MTFSPLILILMIRNCFDSEEYCSGYFDSMGLPISPIHKLVKRGFLVSFGFGFWIWIWI
jgi:hypothetical protein